MTTLDLSGLRDIHLPPEPPFWPLAVGWWVTIGGAIVFILLGIGMYLYWYTRPRQYALRELKTINNRSDSTIALARQMSALFKRIALIRYPRKRVAALSEQEWMRFLLNKTKGALTEDQAKLLAFSTYLPDTGMETEEKQALLIAGQKGIRELFKRKKR